ncbi:START-like domain-containing protein [Wandonia haliotis]|uniref:START-like domain-containing protein n=1 Tax=Wandonia haliotis TaxID=574963 RepID=A0ABN1MK82_9FLAO
MSEKKKYELEYLLKTSPKVLYNLVATPSGLSEWFADNVNVNKDNIYTFIWDGAEEEARLITKRNGECIKWIWMSDEEEGENTYFEFKIATDPMTKSTLFYVIDFAEEDEVEEATELWESQINELKRILGA